MFEQEVKLVNNIPTVFINTKKFKTVSIQIKFRSKLDENRVTVRNLLSKMMVKRTKEFPKEQDLLEYLAQYYGAYLTSATSKKGQDHIVSFNIEMINQKYIRENLNIIKEMCHLLNDMLTYPADYSDKEFLNKEKRLYENRLKALEDNRMHKAYKNLLETMFESEPYQCMAHGTLNKIELVDYAQIKEEHNKMLNEDEMMIFVVGALNDEMKSHIQNIFSRDKEIKHDYISFPYKYPTEIKQTIEQQNVEQAKLVMGMRLNTAKVNSRVELLVFNQLFGGSASSLLFQNVREKLSLCYQIHTSVDLKNGYIFILAGVDHNNIQVAKEAILKELAAIRTGDFLDTLLEEIKNLAIVNRYESLDKPKGLVNIAYNLQLTNIKDSTWEETLKNVTKEDVMNVANNLHLDTVHVLTKGELDGYKTL